MSTESHGVCDTFTTADGRCFIAGMEVDPEVYRRHVALLDLAVAARRLLVDAEDAGWAEGSFAAGYVESALARIDGEVADG